MEAGMLSATDQQSMVSSFLEIAVGQSAETARQFLQATSWKLEEAIQLFYIGNEGGGTVGGSSSQIPAAENIEALAEQTSRMIRLSEAERNVVDEDEVRAPIPVIRGTLYDDALLYGASRMRHPESSSVPGLRNFDEEIKRPGVWEPEQGVASTAENSRDNLASLYRPPYHIMFQGSFEKAKGTASSQDKWLLVNLQSNTEFSSHKLNRDTWSNEAVSQTISTNFVFWQVYDETTEGQKVCTYYKLSIMPVILVIDPITGQKMRSWVGMVEPERLLEDLLTFMDSGPKDHHVTLSHKRPRESSSAQPQKTKVVADKSNEYEEVARALAASMESIKETSEVIPKDKHVNLTEEDEKTCLENKPDYPPLPEEPKGDKSLLCTVGFRLPDGRRVRRSFLRTDPVQLLWSFCCSQLKEAETRPFRLAQPIPGASKSLDYDTEMTFGESGLASSMISVTWE